MLPLSGPSAPTAKRSTPRTHLAKILKSDVVLTRSQAPTPSPGAPLTTSVPLLTPGPLTVARLLPSTTSGTLGLSSVSSYSFSGPGPSSTGPWRTTESRTKTASGLAPTSTHAGHLSTGSPTTGTCHTSISLLDTLPPTRYPCVMGWNGPSPRKSLLVSEQVSGCPATSDFGYLGAESSWVPRVAAVEMGHEGWGGGMGPGAGWWERCGALGSLRTVSELEGSLGIRAWSKAPSPSSGH